MSNETTPVSSNYFNDAVVFIHSQIDAFKRVTEFIVTEEITPGTFFHPATLRKISEELDKNTYLVAECFTILDIVKTYDLVSNGCRKKLFINSVLEAICSSRTLEEQVADPKTNSKESLGDYSFGSKNVEAYMYKDHDNLMRFLLANNALVAMYVVCLVMTITQARKDT